LIFNNTGRKYLQVLMFSGPLALRDIIENAELYPIRGLFQFSDYFPEIDAYYNRTLGYEFGASTGWTALNEIYNVSPDCSFFPSPLNLHFLSFIMEYLFNFR
jgi:hypothetical protein